MDRRTFLVSTLAAAGAASTLSTAAYAGYAEGEEVWRYIAGAEVVVSGVMHLALDQPRERSTYWEIPVDDVTVLKGTPPASLRMRHWAVDSGVLDNEGVPSLANKPALLFLQASEYGLYHLFALDALMPATAENVAMVKAEIAAQRSRVAAWRPDRRLPHYAEVEGLVERIAAIKSRGRPGGRGRSTQEAAFLKLEQLGEPAVAAIINQMDDRRPLAFPQISLRNMSPQAFEGIRHYGPELIVDALDAILNQLVGFGGTLVNGATEARRRNAVDAWRVYAARRLVT